MLQNKIICYQEITLLPSQEININFLMGKIFNSLHLYFVKTQVEGIVNTGISFPEYDLEKKALGSKIRLFFDSYESCEKMNLNVYLKAYDDYIHIRSRRDIPNNVTYAIFKRVQKKGSKQNLANRYSKRKNISYEAAFEQYKNYEKQLIKFTIYKIKKFK